MIRLTLIGLLTAALLATFGCAAGRHYFYQEDQAVRFYLHAPGAERVFFVSSLDDFTPHPANSIGMGGWTFRLPAAEEFRYFYILDDRIYLPPCSYRETDDFGSENCIYRPDL